MAGVFLSHSSSDKLFPVIGGIELGERRIGVSPCQRKPTRTQGRHRWYSEHPQGPVEILAFHSPSLFYKFVIPQMVARHVCFSPHTPLVWDYKDWYIGLA